MRRSLLALLLASGCSSHAPTTHTPLPGPSAKLPEGPPLVTPGEHMTYRLALQGIELASYELAVGDPADVGGKRAIVVQSHAKTVGLGAIVKVDDYFSSWIDVTTGRPLRWTCDEFASNGQDKERTEADLAQRANDVIPIQFHLNDEPPKPEPQKVSMPDVWDYNAFLIALRAWEGPPGSTMTAEVLRSRYLWHVEMKIGSKGMLHTELGDFPVVRLDGHTYKLGRDDQRYPGSDERDFSIWISADDGRVPLKVTAKTDYGDIEMNIVDYAPGSGKRLRN